VKLCCTGMGIITRVRAFSASTEHAVVTKYEQFKKLLKLGTYGTEL
jgi:hypothetical protein